MHIFSLDFMHSIEVIQKKCQNRKFRFEKNEKKIFCPIRSNEESKLLSTIGQIQIGIGICGFFICDPNFCRDCGSEEIWSAFVAFSCSCSERFTDLCQFQQHFTYEFFVRTSFFYVHVTRKSCQNVMFVRKICTFNLDEIDGRP